MGIFVALATTGLLVGCGGGEEREGLSKKAFVKQGNSICEQGIKERDQILNAGFKKLAQSGDEPAKKDVETLILKIIPPLEETTETLSDLQPPKEDEKAISALMQEWQRDIHKASEDPGSAISATFLEAPNLKARAYGLTSCNL